MDKDCHEIWNNCLKVIKANTAPQAYKTWFEPIKPVSFNDNMLTIQVPTQFFYEFLETHYIKLLRMTIDRVIGVNGRLEYSIVMDDSGSDGPVVVRMPNCGPVNTQNPPVQIPIDIDKKAKDDAITPFILPGLKKLEIESQLNENYSFDNFVTGDCNLLARQAGNTIAKMPGRTSFNPLFIYSPTGLGKTHIVHAIGLETKKNFPNLTVLYVNAEQFIQQFMSSCKNKTRNDFVRFYQSIDVLIVDDIEFMAGKAKTQDAFFHIFNHLQQNCKQLVFTCDKPPAELKDMEPRLLSRFKWGLFAELQMPDYDTRKSILKKKAYNEGIELPEDVIDYVAENVKTNVREMEGFLISLMAQSSLNKKAITVNLAKQMVSRYVNNSTPELTIGYIIGVVCESMLITQDEFFSKTRKRNIVQARQLTMYFAKKYTKSSLISIGQECGGKDHATVIHALKTVENLIETDKQFRQIALDIEKNLS